MDDFIEINYVDSSAQSMGTPSKSAKNNKLTDNSLTPFEYTRLLSGTASMIAVGMPYSVEWTGPFDPIAIAKKVIEQRSGSLVVIRKIPGGVHGPTEEMWDLKNLDIRDI